MKLQSFLPRFIINSEFLMFDCKGNSQPVKSKMSPGELNLVSFPSRKMTKPCLISAPGKDFRTRKDLQILKIALCLYFTFEDSTIPLNSAQYFNQSVSILKALSGIASGWKNTNKFQLSPSPRTKEQGPPCLVNKQLASSWIYAAS